MFKLADTKGKEVVEYEIEDFGGLVKTKAEVIKGSCFQCKHCTDVFWDYSHGPYGIMCDLNSGEEDAVDVTSKGFWGECERFEDEKEEQG